MKASVNFHPAQETDKELTANVHSFCDITGILNKLRCECDLLADAIVVRLRQLGLQVFLGCQAFVVVDDRIIYA
jgi:hypothetical protein